MNAKAIVAGVVIIIFLIFGAWSFLESNVEYTDFQSAYETGRTVQVEGTWVKEKGERYNAELNEFTFYMADKNGQVVRVVLDGPRPNNFEIATSVVARGSFVAEDEFRSTNVLTKCPSKYEGSAEEMMGASDNTYYD